MSRLYEGRMMRRYFLFVIPELTYEKKDLNVPVSMRRTIIGRISRMITNAIFLSHSLRKEITIRLFVGTPKPHFIQIESEKIRYLGPGLRSFASLMLKVRKFLLEKIETSTLIEQWYEPNPGLFLKPTSNPFEDLIKSNSPLVDVLSFSHLSEEENNVLTCPTINDFENMIRNYLDKDKILIYYFDFSSSLSFDLQSIAKENNYTFNYVSISRNLNCPKLVSIINIILDKYEK